MVEGSLLRERLLATLSGFFGLLALLLASIGLYGSSLLQRCQPEEEIGIRMALGARARKVRWLILREAIAAVTGWCGGGVALIVARDPPGRDATL